MQGPPYLTLHEGDTWLVLRSLSKYPLPGSPESPSRGKQGPFVMQGLVVMHAVDVRQVDKVFLDRLLGVDG